MDLLKSRYALPDAPKRICRRSSMAPADAMGSPIWILKASHHPIRTFSALVENSADAVLCAERALSSSLTSNPTSACDRPSLGPTTAGSTLHHGRRMAAITLMHASLTMPDANQDRDNHSVPTSLLNVRSHLIL